MILLAGSDACLERFNVLPSSTAGRPTKSVQLLILLPPISDYWPPPHKEGELERQPRWLYFTPFSLPYTQGCLHTHIICLLVFIYAHTDKHAAAWTLKIRSRSCEERGGGGLLWWSMPVCVCVCLCLCVFLFSGGGGGATLQDVLRMASFSNRRQVAHHVEPYTGQTAQKQTSDC